MYLVKLTHLHSPYIHLSQNLCLKTTLFLFTLFVYLFVNVILKNVKCINLT